MLFFSEEDKEELLSSIHMIEVIHYLGIEYVRKGGYYSILCPSPQHNDRKLGNCIVYDYNYYCWHCGASGDAVTLIRETTNCSVYEALCQLAVISGMESKYEASGSNYQEPKKHILLQKEDLNELGLSLHLHRSYCPVSFGKNDDRKGNYKDCLGNPIKVSSTSFPTLRELAINEPDVFIWLIEGKTMEKLEDIYNDIYKVSNPSKFYYVRSLYVYLTKIGISVSDLLTQIFKRKSDVIESAYNILNQL